VNPLGDKQSPSGFTELYGDLRALKLCPQAGMLRGLESPQQRHVPLHAGCTPLLHETRG